MSTIEVIGHVDDQHQLHVELPADVKPGPVKVAGQHVTQAGEAGDWRPLIDQSWAKGWSDAREDIYTLEDGKPSHGPR